MDYQLSAFADESSNDFAGQVAALRRNGISGLENVAGGLSRTTSAICLLIDKIEASIEEHGW